MARIPRLLAAFLVLALASPAAAERMRFVVPAYQYPTLGTLWADLAAAAPHVPVTAILDPDNGPGAVIDPNYTAAVSALRAAGGRVYGYVYTHYATRPDSAVLADVDRFRTFYPLDGWFVDEVTPDASPAHLAYYATLLAGIRARTPLLPILGNPGINCDAAYADAAHFDQLLTYEHFAGYDTWLPQPWMAAQPPTRFVNAIYARHTVAGMIDAIQRASRRNVANVYVTDDSLDNPWDTTPPYWATEVAVVETTSVAGSALGVADAPAAAGLRVLGSPSRGVVRFALGPSARARTIELFDATGRGVARLPIAPGAIAAAWDGRGRSGTPAAAGLYFARLAGTRTSARIAWLR